MRRLSTGSSKVALALVDRLDKLTYMLIRELGRRMQAKESRTDAGDHRLNENNGLAKKFDPITIAGRMHLQIHSGASNRSVSGFIG